MRNMNTRMLSLKIIEKVISNLIHIHATRAHSRFLSNNPEKCIFPNIANSNASSRIHHRAQSQPCEETIPHLHARASHSYIYISTRRLNDPNETQRIRHRRGITSANFLHISPISNKTICIYARVPLNLPHTDTHYKYVYSYITFVQEDPYV